MTLDEAIAHSKKIVASYAETVPDCKCAKEHSQLAAWLEELKKLRAGQSDEIESLERQVEYWKAAALELGDIEAATAWDVGDRRTASKMQKRRHGSICEKAVRTLSGDFPPSHFAQNRYYTAEGQKRVVDRLKDAQETCQKGLQ